jgi:uncharacterized protein (DUF1015 family)
LPEFFPFAGVRYDCAAMGTDLGVVAAPPYDVVDEDEHVALEAAHPHNSVRLILPRDELCAGDRYARAAAAFASWRDAGVLVADPTPRFYAYRMEYRTPQGEARRTRGVIGALGLPDGPGHEVLPHERTLPKAKSDRLALLRAMRVNVDPIWGLSLGAGLTELLEPATPLCSCEDTDRTRHTLAAIDDPGRVAAIAAVVGRAPLVLADGHHRFETACAYRDEREAAGIDDPGAGAIMCFVVELVDDELTIEPIHRLVDLPAGAELRALLADAFDLTPVGPNTPEAVDALVARMRATHALGLVEPHGLTLARARADVRASALAGEHRAVVATDAAVVEALVVPRLPGASFHYRHDAAAAAALVEKGSASAAILCSPVTVAETRAAAIDRVRMPQKTTFFWPKPRTGMVFRTLDGP